MKTSLTFVAAVGIIAGSVAGVTKPKLPVPEPMPAAFEICIQSCQIRDYDFRQCQEVECNPLLPSLLEE